MNLQYNGPSADNKVLLTLIDWYRVEMIPLCGVIFCSGGGCRVMNELSTQWAQESSREPTVGHLSLTI